MMQRIAGVLSAALLFVAGVAIFNATRSDPEPATDVEATAEITPATTSTTTTSTTTTTTTTTTLPPPRSARLAFTGDLLPHGSVQRAGSAFAEGWDFAPLYEEVRPIIEGADLAICHLETPISIDDTNLSGYLLFSAPRASAQAAPDVGYDGCSSPPTTVTTVARRVRSTRSPCCRRSACLRRSGGQRRGGSCAGALRRERHHGRVTSRPPIRSTAS